jgi:hypothetical protein
VPLAHRGDAPRPRHHRRRPGRVVVGGVRARGRGRQQPAVEHPADHHRDPARLAQRQQPVERGLVQQGVAAGQQHHVEVGVAHQVGQHLPLVHAGADGADRALRAQLVQGGVGLLDRRPPVVVRVVQQCDVDAVQGEALQAGLQRPPYPRPREVPHPPVGRGHGEALAVAAGRAVRVGHQEAAYLGRHHQLGSRPRRQRAAQAPFREAQPVVGGGVEEAHAGPQRRRHRRDGGGLLDGLVEAADRGAAEAEGGDPDGAGAQGRRPHQPVPGPAAGGGRRSPCMPPSTASAVPVVAPARGLAR